MATLQTSKVLGMETMTKTAIDQKQSLEVVQTMLHASLSSVTYLRELFAEKAFDEVIYEQSDKVLSYTDYAGGKMKSVKDRQKGAQGTIIQILRRGRSKRVDMFLDWLEKAAFVALQTGILRAIQVYVHADPTDRDKVIETYTFTVRYNEDVNNTRNVAGLRMESTKSSLVGAEATNSALQEFLEQAKDMCDDLPQLPAPRYISMALFYVDNGVKNFRAQGFVPTPTDALMYAQAEGWERTVNMLSSLNSGYHSSSLRLSYLQKPTKPVESSCAQGFYSSVLPYDLRYTTPTTKQAEFDVANESVQPTALVAKTLGDVVTHEAATPFTIVDAEKLNTGCSNSETFSRVQIDRPHDARSMQDNESPTLLPSAREPGLALVPDTQSSNITDMRRAFQDMVQPEQVTQGDTQMQTADDRSHTPLSESTATPSVTSPSSFRSKVNLPRKAVKPVLSPTKARLLSNDTKRLKRKAKEAGKKAEDGDTITCQCGHAEEEDDMVQCVFCSTWQHLHCYGYTDQHDVRLPDEHVCYLCLLGDSEPLGFKRLQELTLKRRAMSFALQHGLTTQRQFNADYGGHGQIAAALYQQLKADRYVVPATKSHKASSQTARRAHFVAVRDGPDHDNMLRNLFDPLLHISHHYTLPAGPVTQPTGLTQRLLAAQAKNMPPPATPASQSRRRDVATPAASRAMRTMPTPSPSRQLRGHKRAMGEHANDESASKRRSPPDSSANRYKGLQSEFVLDAGGFPSSPFGLQEIR